MKKKIVSLIGALVLICAMSLNVFAAGSKTAQDVVNAAGGVTVPALGESAEKAEKIITADGLEVKELTTDDAYPLAVEMAKLKSDATDVEVVVMADLKAGSDTITVKMSVKSTETAYALHLNANGKVDKLDGVVSGDTVVFKFSSYSPVAIVKVIQKTNDPAPQPTNNNNNNNTTAAATTTVNGAVVPAAPKTGDTAMMVIVMAVIFLAGAVVAMSRRRA